MLASVVWGNILIIEANSYILFIQLLIHFVCQIKVSGVTEIKVAILLSFAIKKKKTFSQTFI